MADGSDGPDVSPPAAAEAGGGGEIWGTLEELLLACAVSRHGTGSWDSVAMEVQTRSPLAARPGLTPTSCRLRFRQIHRRFSVGGDGGGPAVEEEEEDDEAEGGPDASAADGWMDELRRLRVAELRREVERCDLSIGTLQTKVKRLREEREQSNHGGEGKTETGNGDERLSSEEPGRSCRESNSTDLKPAARAGDHSVKAEEEDDDEAAAAAKQEASGESVAASKESSDLRSSASLCRRHRKPGADEDADGEEASAPRPPAQSSSQPLAALLDTFAARFGPLLERLQERERRVPWRDQAPPAGGGGAAAAEFYRDLLLLCANALVFFPRAGPEHGAAGEARALVSASLRLREPKQEPGAAAAMAAAAEYPPVEDARRAEGVSGGGAGIVGSLIEKGGKPLIVCRKRSSIAKAAAAAKKEESMEKGEVPEEGEGSDDGEKKVSVSAASKDKAWGLRTKKGRGPGKNSAGGGHSRKMAKLSEATTETSTDGGKKGDKKVADAAGPAKKRNAVDFLKRLNQGSSPSKKKNKGSPMGTRKRAAATSPEQPQKTRKVPGRKEAGRGGSKKGGKSATPKRSVGRPPSKRGASAATTPPPSKRAKVSRSEKTTTTTATKRGGRR
uniref:Myb-like domain-containing protein n=1 Tax=Oryza punctata TaxID=4537 RepID=A0A0E0M2U0_ORYPU